MTELLDGLNTEQREAASTLEGPVLVLAGAGTGKTRVITYRIAHMIEQGIPPSSIMGVTFTNKAAREMRERLAKLVDPSIANTVMLGTFHAFCARVLRRDIHLAGNYNSKYSIADESDQESLIRQAAAELGYSKDEVPTREAAAYIGRCKNKLFTPEDALDDAAEKHPAEMPLAEIYERYQKILELQNTVDFDDILNLTLKIFRDNPETLQRYRNTYRYLLVDEYQDTNAAQFNILYMLAGEKHNICVVGDDDQSIYAWRGADVSNILQFPEYFPGAKQIKLEQNYRSTNKILETANAVISKNERRYDKNLWSAKGQGENLCIVKLKDGEDEARFVADAVEDLVARNPEKCYSDVAILYRSNHLSRAFEQEFRRRGVRPKIIGGQEFFQRKEVKDAAAYLKLIINPRDDQSLLRILSVPPRGMGDKAIETLRHLQKVTGLTLSQLLAEKDYHAKVTAAAAKSAELLAGSLIKWREFFQEKGNLASKVNAYLDEVGYLNGLQKIYKDYEESEKRRENVQEFISYIGLFDNERDKNASIDEFMESYSLMDENDRTEDGEDRDAPTLTTIHAAKGLEFPCVFIVGLEQNLFPHERALMEGADAEERRLFYVAITRARERLFLTHARERFKYKEFVRQLPSVFLRDIPEEFSEKPDPAEFFPKSSNEKKLAAFRALMKELE